MQLYRTPWLAAVMLLVNAGLSPVHAETQDPVAVAESLKTATGPDAVRLLEKFPLDQLPALVKAVSPNEFDPKNHDAVMAALNALIRKSNDFRKRAQAADEAAWGKRTGVDVYVKSSYRGPDWDAVVVKALTPGVINPPTLFHDAIAAGCKDPLIRYYAIRRGLAARSLSNAEAITQYLALAPDFASSPYPPSRKFQLHIQLLRLASARLKIDPEAQGIASRAFDQAVALLPDLAKEKPEFITYREDFMALVDATSVLHIPVEAALPQMEGALTKMLGDDAFVNAIRANLYINWAWQARGDEPGGAVTGDGGQLFNERLNTGKAIATAGAAHDPLDTLCPIAMITICKALGTERSIMEGWFTKAMLASPDNYSACHAKLSCLRPRWGGSSEAQLEFGHQCFQTGTPANRIPTILVDAHGQVAEDSGNPDDYYTQPQVWTDIDGVYQKLLADQKAEIATNNLRFDHAKYIYFAARCQQWATVLKLCDQFKDDVDFSVFGSKAVYEFTRKQAQQQLANSPG